MFGRRGVGDAAPSRCPSIIVRRSSLDDGGDRYALAQDVVNFVNHATGEAMFRRDELPQDALRAFHVDYYIAQVNNGGHGQFAHNSRWDEQVLRDIGEGSPPRSGISVAAFARRRPWRRAAGTPARR